MIKVKAPINIALIKYWGKQESKDVKPSTPSISLTLKAFETTTEIEKTNESFLFSLNGEVESNISSVKTFIKQFTNDTHFKITSVNSGPTAAGLASSASGYSALGLALNTMYPHDEKTFRQYVANGSGSAIRSLMGGAVKWDTDGTITQIPFNHQNYFMAMILINTNKKKIASRTAMAESKKTNVFKGFVSRNTQRAKLMENAMRYDDFHEIGLLMEESTLDLHALPIFHEPPFSFLTTRSIKIIQQIRELRKNGLFGYFTADTGPNIKVLFKRNDLDAFKAFFNTLNTPYVISEIDPLGARVL